MLQKLESEFKIMKLTWLNERLDKFDSNPLNYTFNPLSDYIYNKPINLYKSTWSDMDRTNIGGDYTEDELTDLNDEITRDYGDMVVIYPTIEVY